MHLFRTMIDLKLNDKTMKKYCAYPIAAVCCILALNGCSKDVLMEFDSDGTPINELRIGTRAGDDATTVTDGRIYIFNNSGECVSVLSTDQNAEYTSAKLPAGTYSVYAVGGNDLNRFTLPDQTEATTTSWLTLEDGKVMDDLLLSNTSVTMEGEDKTLDIELNRKVMSVSSVTIKKVPTDVTAVEVMVSPLYSKVKIDGTFDTNDTGESYTFTLTKDADGTTWDYQTAKTLFPSKGKPTITITFKRGENNATTYSYEAAGAFAANKRVKIEGTYTESQGVTLTGTLTSEAWGEESNVEFDFDNTNSSQQGNGNDDNNNNNNTPSGTPVAGETYLGCYVVSVDADAKTAVLLSPKQTNGYTSAATVNTAVASWAVEGIAGTWRLPTVAEVNIFIVNRSIANPDQGKSMAFYCLSGSSVAAIEISRNYADKYTVKAPVTDFDQIGTSTTYLRPVTDYSYE